MTFGRPSTGPTGHGPPPRLFPLRGAVARVGRFLLALTTQAECPRRASPNRSDALRADTPTNTTRKPLLLLRLSGVLLLRFDDNRLSGSLLFHDPPRNTRIGPRHRFRRPSMRNAEISKKIATASR